MRIHGASGWLFLLLGVTVGAAGTVAAGLLEVGPPRKSLDWTDVFVQRVELEGLFGFYVEAQPLAHADVLNGLLVMGIATLALIGAFLAHQAARLRRRFYSISAAGLGFLAFDELGSVHESIGLNARFLADLPGIDHPDDPIVVLYGLTALIFLIIHRRVYQGSRQVLILLAAAGAAYALGAVADIGSLASEENFELLSTVCLGGAYVSLFREDLHRLQLPPVVQSHERSLT